MYLNFTNAKILDFEQIKSDLFSESSLLLTGANSLNSIEFQNCLIELNAIQNGLNNFEKWAIKCKSNHFFPFQNKLLKTYVCFVFKWLMLGVKYHLAY